ncbi:MAG: MTH1187 family thiamine-binding protein [Nitrospirota bacterium]|nr:MAG: MTH1187 family thiamine-binding protein [Nitrospirota bacterium]
MLAEFSIVPVGAGDSLGAKIAGLLDIVESSGLRYKLNPMGTVIEGEWDEVMDAVKACHARIMEDSPRAVTTIKIDDRKGRTGMIDGKIASVEKNLGREVKQ